MTRNERIDHWQNIIDGIVADYKRLKHACDAAIKVGAMDGDGPLYDAIWNSFEGMLDRLDVDGWIAWFIHDNVCGKKGMQAKGCGSGKKAPVKNSRHLAKLIVESEG